MYMSMNSNKLFFIIILFFSTLIAISSNSWFGCWIGLEINLLSFIPLISNLNNMMTSEASLKYFLTQTLASANLMIMILINYIMYNFFLMNNELMMMMMNSSLLMKLGAAPFHFWFPNIMEGLSWMNCFILMTWQKITPMILLLYFYSSKFMMIIVIISSIMGAIGGLNQTSLRKLLAFSSINHISWMIMSFMISNNMWIFYFIIYSLLTMMMCIMFYSLNSYYLNQIFYMNINNLIKMFLFINLLSLGGLPPFLGFLPKWIILNNLINVNIMISIIMMMMSLVTLYFYIRITYSSFMMKYLKIKWFKMNIKNLLMKFMFFLSTLLNLGLIAITLIYYIY